jgi:glutamate racemase
MNESPIGIFDSGIGGLSVLQSLQAALPAEHFVYWADSGHAPYGEKSDLFVRERSLAITEHLLQQHHIKALVVACNTATAAAIHELRSKYPHLILIGVEPALKPALQISKTGHIGVIGTRGTLSSDKFNKLLGSLHDQAHFTDVALGEQAAMRIHQLLEKYTREMGVFGSSAGQMDTLVLGCTHYVFAEKQLQSLLGPDVHLVSTGEPVARQTRRLLEAACLLRNGPEPRPTSARIQLLTNGDLPALQAAAQRWLDLPHLVCHRADSRV